MPHNDLKNNVALVTGGSRGIGRAICLKLAADGAAIAVNYRHQAAQAEEVVRQIESSGGRAIAVQADVSEAAQVTAMSRQVVAALGPVDILINNAGLMFPGDLSDFDFSQMDPMRRTNVDGVVHCTRAFVDSMKQRRFGRIVNVTSLAALGTAMLGTTFYAATKAAVSILTRRFAMELGPFGVTVNAIAPGTITTDMTQRAASPEELRKLNESRAAKTMVGRMGEPEDIAHVAAFLVSPASSFITAQVIAVDGGRMDYIGHG